MDATRIRLPAKLMPIFAPPRGSVRYRGAFGGRGSGKSFSFAQMAAVWGYMEPMRILCAREFQASIKDSFHAELKNVIGKIPFLAHNYDVGVDYIRGKNGTEFIFKGLRNNIQSVKSLAKIKLCIVEEAEDVPEASWLDLEPTIREPGSEIWAIWNPKTEGSPIDNRLRVNYDPNDMLVTEINYKDNPWFPGVLEDQRKRDQRNLDPDTYAHIWEGAYLKRSKAQVFAHKYEVDEFTPIKTWDGPYFGLDFGFSTDPTAGGKMWVYDDVLYIEHESYHHHLEIDDTPETLKRDLPGIEHHTCYADNARPESISYLRRHGLRNMKPCEKWKGCVEDGVEFIKSFRKIIIHPRCENAIKELSLYSYKVDRLTGDVLPILIDANNHFIDAVRYGIGPIIKGTFTDYGSLL